MSKLFKLKEFFSIEEAAGYLSGILKEPVYLSDIYRLALDKHITMSVRLISHTLAIRGMFIHGLSNRKTCHQIDRDLDTNEVLDEPEYLSEHYCTQVNENQWLVFDRQMYCIDGLWDLPMIGGESLEVERLYLKALNETGQVRSTFAPINSIFLKRNNLFCKLFNQLVNQPPSPKRVAIEKELECILGPKGLTIDDISLSDTDDLEFDVLVEKCTANEIIRVSMLVEKLKYAHFDERYQKSITFENDSYQLVIKTNELTRFVQSLQDEPLSPPLEDKPLAPRERNTLLTLIGALCKQLDIDPSARGVTSAVQSMTELTGAPLSDDSIRKILTQVEPALERRQK